MTIFLKSIRLGTDFPTLSIFYIDENKSLDLLTYNIYNENMMNF